VSTEARQASRVKPKGNGALTKQSSAVTTEEGSISSAATPKEQSVSSAPTEIPEDKDSQIEEATNEAARNASEPSQSPDTSNTDSPKDELETSNPAPLAPENSSQQTEYAQRIELLEKELQAARGTITELQEKEEESQLKDEIMDDLKNKLQSEMGKRAEAEDASRRVKEKAEKVTRDFSTLQEKSKERIGLMKAAIDILMTSEKKMQDEMVDIREERDEQTRRLNSYTERLNGAKKNEAVKVNTSDHYESKVDDLHAQVKECKEEMAQLKFERDRYKKELGNWKKFADQRTKQLEGQVKHEKKLNDERKRKMKVFVEAKTEEARSTRADNVSLQAELDQTTLSLKDFNERYKQLHSQWVKSQTRNRELQRDMTKMNYDSEKMSKVGGTLEAKLSRSANEIEDHKNKRMTAKNELMIVIAQLEEEKKSNSRLREYVRSTFTPKVLSQQQSLRENLDNFEAGLKKLALRFGRELPAPRKNNGQPNKDSEVAAAKMSTMEEIQSKVSNANAVRVLAKLEEETQRVNQHIATVSTNVDQLLALLVAPTTKGCVGAMFNF
jgi:chromosome segregation ATPase